MTAAPFQLFPDLEPAVEAALRESIRHFGVVYPAVVDQHGQVIDGHHRLRIADEEGVDCPAVVREVADDDEAAELAFTLNADRRQIPAEHRRAIVATLRQQGHSLRAIAGAVGASQTTVANDLNCQPVDSSPERVTGLDGKTRPAARPADELEARRAAAAARKAEQENERARNDAELQAAKKEYGLDGPIDPAKHAAAEAWNLAVGALIGRCDSVEDLAAKYEPAAFVAQLTADKRWRHIAPRVTGRVTAARDWLNALAKEMNL